MIVLLYLLGGVGGAALAFLLVILPMGIASNEARLAERLRSRRRPRR